jgi:Pvc16 N-terminal domain
MARVLQWAPAMINYLDRMLAQVILDRVDSTLFIGFQPPDDDWRTKAIPGNVNAVNVFLTELRENRRLRSNERVRTVVNGDVTELPEPRRMDCHYLITAWSPATPQVDPTLDEHALLGAIASAFANADPLRALDIFAGIGIPAGMPAVLLGYSLPVTLMPVEGFHKYAEFWGTMGRHHQPWKPAVYVIATLPLQPDVQTAGPMVTTAMAAMLQAGAPSSAEILSVIGGAVRDSQTPPQPVALAWVELLTPLNVRLQLVSTDSQGRFTFAGVPSSAYRLRATGPSSGPILRDIDVPSLSGEYDLQL